MCLKVAFFSSLLVVCFSVVHAESDELLQKLGALWTKNELLTTVCPSENTETQKQSFQSLIDNPSHLTAGVLERMENAIDPEYVRCHQQLLSNPNYFWGRYVGQIFQKQYEKQTIYGGPLISSKKAHDNSFSPLFSSHVSKLFSEKQGLHITHSFVELDPRIVSFLSQVISQETQNSPLIMVLPLDVTVEHNYTSLLAWHQKLFSLPTEKQKHFLLVSHATTQFKKHPPENETIHLILEKQLDALSQGDYSQKFPLSAWLHIYDSAHTSHTVPWIALANQTSRFRIWFENLGTSTSPLLDSVINGPNKSPYPELAQPKWILWTAPTFTLSSHISNSIDWVPVEINVLSPTDSSSEVPYYLHAADTGDLIPFLQPFHGGKALLIHHSMHLLRYRFQDLMGKFTKMSKDFYHGVHTLIQDSGYWFAFALLHRIICQNGNRLHTYYFDTKNQSHIWIQNALLSADLKDLPFLQKRNFELHLVSNPSITGGFLLKKEGDSNILAVFLPPSP